MNKKQMLAYSFFFVLCCTSALSFAGECMDEDEATYQSLVQALKKGAEFTDDQNYTLGCLSNGLGYTLQGYEYFATDSAMEKIRSSQTKARAEIPALLHPYLERVDMNEKCRMAHILAYLGDKTIFDTLMQCSELQDKEPADGTYDALLFAILGDARAVPWIIKKYQQIDEYYRAKPLLSYPDKMNYLNDLYHLASHDSLKFIETIVKNPVPPKVRSRAEMVRKKIMGIGRAAIKK